MASLYKLGNTYGGKQTLDALNLPDPFPASFTHATETYADGVGQPQADGFARVIWRFDILSISQWGTLMSTFTGQSRQVFITTRRDISAGTYADQFEEYRGYMVRPDYEDFEIEMGYFYRNVEVYFEAVEVFAP